MQLYTSAAPPVTEYIQPAPFVGCEKAAMIEYMQAVVVEYVQLEAVTYAAPPVTV